MSPTHNRSNTVPWNKERLLCLPNMCPRIGKNGERNQKPCLLPKILAQWNYSLHLGFLTYGLPSFYHALHRGASDLYLTTIYNLFFRFFLYILFLDPKFNISLFMWIWISSVVKVKVHSKKAALSPVDCYTKTSWPWDVNFFNNYHDVLNWLLHWKNQMLNLYPDSKRSISLRVHYTTLINWMWRK